MHLGPLFNIQLSKEEFARFQSQHPNYQRILDKFSLYKQENGFVLLRDYDALEYFLEHGELPRGVFDQQLSEESVRILREIHSDIIDYQDQS